MLTKLLDYAAAPCARRPRRSDGGLRTTTVLVWIIAFFGAQTVVSGMSEGFCLVWPGIGTHFAPGFSHIGFARVQPGMTKAEVLKLLGEPLGVASQRPAPSGWRLWQRGDITWSYSGDSGALGGDWAWLSHEVVFRDGIVVQKVKWVYHD